MGAKPDEPGRSERGNRDSFMAELSRTPTRINLQNMARRLVAVLPRGSPNHWFFRPIGKSEDASHKKFYAWSPRSIVSMTGASSRLRRYTLFAVMPAVCLVTAIFFYALPRTTRAARMQNRGDSLIGFNDQVRLDDFGRLLNNSTTALRIELKNRRTGANYRANGALYLRGRVLEEYNAGFSGSHSTATWSTLESAQALRKETLPREFVPRRQTDENFFDSVSVTVNCASMRTPSLFAIAPYHRSSGTGGLLHDAKRWTVARQSGKGLFFPAIEYQFGTNAFSKGAQSQWTANVRPPRMIFSRELLTSRAQQDAYEAELVTFDAVAMPGVKQIAADIMQSIPGNRRNAVTVARAFERHLASAGGFSYSMDLNSNNPGDVDPIEHFVASHKKGHCQYFASALAMMLRSVDIPSRLVVGYRTDEYNDFGQFFTARQSHAHAWVEALVDRDEMDENVVLYGQVPSDQYWLRLDPTPGTAAGASGPTAGVDQVLNLAENVWEKYVVGMDARRQDESIMAPAEIAPVETLASWFQNKITRIRAGELGRGSLAGPETFSWQAALAGAIVTIALCVLLKLPIRKLIGKQFSRKTRDGPDKPAIPFYAEALRQLERIGFHRQAHETPREFLASTSDVLKRGGVDQLVNPLAILTDSFYEARYGTPVGGGNQNSSAQTLDTAKQTLRVAVDRLALDRALLKELASLKSNLTEHDH